MDRRWTYASCTVGALALGLMVGLDTVRAMDPLPVFIPAKPRAPYETPYQVPADDHAYPVAVALPVPREPRPQLVEASYDDDLDMRYATGALVTTDAPSQVEVEPLAPPAADPITDLQ